MRWTSYFFSTDSEESKNHLLSNQPHILKDVKCINPLKFPRSLFCSLFRCEEKVSLPEEQCVWAWWQMACRQGNEDQQEHEDLDPSCSSICRVWQALPCIQPGQQTPLPQWEPGSGSGEASGVAKNSWPMDGTADARKSVKFLYGLVSPVVSELKAAGMLWSWDI